jgi:hypothetical protein
MAGDQDEVPAGAVIAAMELVKGLGDNENAMRGMHAILLLKRCAALTFFNCTRRHQIAPGPCRAGDVLRSSRGLSSQRGEGRSLWGTARMSCGSEVDHAE